MLTSMSSRSRSRTSSSTADCAIRSSCHGPGSRPATGGRRHPPGGDLSRVVGTRYARPVSADTYVDEAAPGAVRAGGARDAIKTKGLRYAGVSVFNVILGQGLLIIFYRLFSASDQALAETSRLVRGGGANTLAVVISAVPAYYLSRAFVWG